MNPYQPKTGEPCHCKLGIARDNYPDCEGTGQKIDFKEIREVIENPRRFDIAEILKSSKRRNKCYILSDMIERLDELMNEHNEDFSKTFDNEIHTLKEYTERLGADFDELAVAVKYLTEIALHQHNQTSSI
jgi:hypothetical protein